MLIASVHDPAGNGPVVLESISNKENLNGANGAHHNGGSGHLGGSQASAPEADGSAKTLRVGIVLSLAFTSALHFHCASYCSA